MHWETVAKLMLVLICVLALYFLIKEINVLKEVFLKWFSLG